MLVAASKPEGYIKELPKEMGKEVCLCVCVCVVHVCLRYASRWKVPVCL